MTIKQMQVLLFLMVGLYCIPVFIIYALMFHPGSALTEKPVAAGSMEQVEDGKWYDIWRHKETGCHYIVTGGSSSSYIVMVTDTGKPFCN